MNRVMTMQEAISRYIKSGDLLFIGGMHPGEELSNV